MYRSPFYYYILKTLVSIKICILIQHMEEDGVVVVMLGTSI
jgi:hypothetical protein